jgi:hypothetical protein
MKSSRKLCQNIFDVHRFDLLNVLDTLREAFYHLPEPEDSKQEDKQDDKIVIDSTITLLPEPAETLTPPAQPIAQGRKATSPSPLRSTATPPPVTSDPILQKKQAIQDMPAVQGAPAVQDTAASNEEQRLSPFDVRRRTSSLPSHQLKAIPIAHIQRKLIRLLKKEPTSKPIIELPLAFIPSADDDKITYTAIAEYDEAEILKTISQAFEADSGYTRREQLHLLGTLAVVAKGMRKKKIMNTLSQLESRTLTHLTHDRGKG